MFIDALFILKTFQKANYQAYIVGGAVRDILLNKTPTDFDITTSCPPNKTIELFKDYDMYLSGLKHGTVSVIINHRVYEITTFRQDGLYLDNRHPQDVYFSDNVLDDIKRRDFSINAIMIDVDGKVYDPLNYSRDLELKIIKTIGDPDTRFKEDALRIMRAIRFKAQLNFQIEDKTYKSLFKNASLLNNISNERKASEFIKILHSDHLEVLDEFKDILNTYIKYDYDPNLNNTNNLNIILTILFKNNPDELNKLFLNKKILITIKKYIKYLNYTNLTKTLSDIDNIEEFIELIKVNKHIDISKEYELIKDYIVNENTLIISAKELMALGYKDKAIGDIKKILIDKIINHEFKNKYEDIMTYLKEVL